MAWARPPSAAETFLQGFGEAEALWCVTGGLVRLVRDRRVRAKRRRPRPARRARGIMTAPPRAIAAENASVFVTVGERGP
jgi:hypothetical protein